MTRSEYAANAALARPSIPHGLMPTPAEMARAAQRKTSIDSGYDYGLPPGFVDTLE